MGSKHLTKRLYGNTVMGQEPSQLKRLKTFQLQDVKDYYNNFYTPTVTKHRCSW
jgi:predicted Zn-dependent peptidase